MVDKIKPGMLGHGKDRSCTYTLTVRLQFLDSIRFGGNLTPTLVVLYLVARDRLTAETRDTLYSCPLAQRTSGRAYNSPPHKESGCQTIPNLSKRAVGRNLLFDVVRQEAVAIHGRLPQQLQQSSPDKQVRLVVKDKLVM